MLFKNTAGQGLYVYAYDRTTGDAATGDAANITATISKDGAAPGATNDVNPTEIGGGIYHFDLTQGETNADRLAVIPVSATPDVVLDPMIVLTDAGRVDAAIGTRATQTSVDAVQVDVAGLDGAAMRGTDGAATAAALATAQADLDVLTGADGATLSTAERTTLVAGVWAAGARTLTSFGTLAADVAAAVWAAVVRTLTAGTKDAEIDSINARLPADPADQSELAALIAGIPAGASQASVDAIQADVDEIRVKTDLLGSAQITVVSPVAQNGTITIFFGDDYLLADGRQIDVTLASGSAEWPDLTAATVVFKTKNGSTVISKAMTVVVPTGAGQKVRLELTDTETLTLARGTSTYEIEATLVGGSVVTLVQGLLNVNADVR